MKKYKEYIIKIPTTEFGYFFLRSKNNLLRDLLKNHWEKFLSTYQLNKKKMSCESSSSPFGTYGHFEGKRDYQCFSLQSCKEKAHLFIRQDIEKNFFSTHKVGRKILRIDGKNLFYLKKKKNFFQYNYLILAKIVDLLGDTQIVQTRIRDLIKIQVKHLEVEKLFQIKLFKSSLFLRWISYLLIDQIYQFIQITSSILGKFRLISLLGPVWRNKIQVEIQNNGNFLFLKCQDFLMGNWYQKKIQAWSYQVLAQTTETRVNQSDTRNFNLPDMGKKLIYYPQNEISNKYHTLKKKKMFTEKVTQLLRQGSLEELERISSRLQRTNRSKQRYFQVIKNILLKSKVITQVDLIQKLNKIVGNWDTFIVNNITKKKSIKLNLLLYQLLWQWGLARHRNKKAKWIENRYWPLRP